MKVTSQPYLYSLFENHRTRVVLGPDGVECIHKGIGGLADIELFHIKNTNNLRLPCDEYFLILIKTNEFLYFPFTEYGEGDEFFNTLCFYKNPVLLNIQSFSQEEHHLNLKLSDGYILDIKSLPYSDNRTSFNHIRLFKNGQLVIDSDWPFDNSIINNSTTDLNLNLIDKVSQYDQKMIHFRNSKIQIAKKNKTNRFYLIIIVILLLLLFYIVF